jgi:hypothetical protein
MEIDSTWLPTLLCAVNDGIKYNDGLKRSQTIKDSEEIEDWMLQMFQFKQYLYEQLKRDPALFERCQEYLDK